MASSSSSSSPPIQPPPLHVAIVGGGIAGLCLGIGLQARGVDFTIYERAAGVQEVGAGIGLSPNAERAMRALAPAVHAAYEAAATPNGEDYFQWVGGLDKVPLFRLFVGEGGFRGLRRSDFLEELIKALPPGRVRFGMRLRDVVLPEQDGDGDGAVLLRFEDGSTASADTVIGCDGIRSRLRAFMFRDGPPTAATYSHKYSFRALLPMDQALARLGPAMCATRYMYNGPGAHIITYPVAGGAYLNALAVVSDPDEWPSSSSPTTTTNTDDASDRDRQSHSHTGSATRDEARRAFDGWHPDVRAVVELLPARMDKWAIFDMLAHPAPRYHEGARLCLAGDAAHAVGPHLGAGAGFGIEDACLLAELLDDVQRRRRGGGDGVEVPAAAGGGQDDVPSLARCLGAAFSVYSDVRYERTQWLVRETREAVDLFEWKNPETSRDPEKYGKEVTWRFHKIWDYDIDGMITEARLKLSTLVDREPEA